MDNILKQNLILWIGAFSFVISVSQASLSLASETMLEPGERYLVQTGDIGKVIVCKKEVAKSIVNVYCECIKDSHETAHLDRIVEFSEGPGERTTIKRYGWWQTDCRGEAATLPACRKN